MADFDYELGGGQAVADSGSGVVDVYLNVSAGDATKINDPSVGLRAATLPNDFSHFGDLPTTSANEYKSADQLGDAWWAVKTGDDVITTQPTGTDSRGVMIEENPVNSGDGFLKTALNQWGKALTDIVKVGASTLFAKAGTSTTTGGRAGVQTSLGDLLHAWGIGTPNRGAGIKPAPGLPTAPLILMVVVIFIIGALVLRGRR